MVEDLYDPEINVRYGSFYLRRLLRKYDDERLALAAYNAGQANVDEWIAEDEGIAVPRDAGVRGGGARAARRLRAGVRDELGLD